MDNTSTNIKLATGVTDITLSSSQKVPTESRCSKDRVAGMHVRLELHIYVLDCQLLENTTQISLNER